MVRRPDPESESESEPVEHDDEQLGEAIEAFLALAEAGAPPDPEEFAARYPEQQSDLLAALQGLALVQGLVGDPGGSGHGHGHGGRLETGRRIAGYRIVRELGRGGMGVVYEAVHVALDRPVALKVLATPAAPDSSGRRRFLNEAKTAAGLHHTHIVPVFDVGQVGGLSYYAMQRIEGSGLDCVVRHLRRGRATAAGSSQSNATPFWPRWNSLRPSPDGRAARGPLGSENVTASWSIGAGRIGAISGRVEPTQGGTGTGFGLSPGGPGFERPHDRDDGPPPFEPPRGSGYYRWVAEVGRASADALDHAHTRGVIHRDIKPSNLLVDGRGFIWVADFGLARRIADPDQTHHESLIGTPRYMSPEQTRNDPVDGRTDLYSLGATLYELLALRPPFDGRSTAELVEQIGRVEPASPRQVDPKIPRDLETIVLKLLSKRGSERYQTASELSDDLTRFLHHEPVQARRISLVGRFIRFARRHPSGTAVTAAAAATVLAVSTWAYIRVLDERDVALKAKADTQVQRDAAVKARAETLTALRTQLLASASLVRTSNEPNRRVKGMGLLHESTALKPEPALQGKLRDEAVEFLVIRDVEARPSFATGRARGLAFGADGSRMAALTQNDEGDFFKLFDVAARTKIVERSLRDDNRGQGGGGGGGPGGGGPGGGRRWMESGPMMAAAGESIAVVSLDGHGIRLFDASTGARLNDLTMPGRRILALYAAPDGRRLITVESTRRGDRDRPPFPPQSVHYAVNLWDPKSETLEKPLQTLVQYDHDGPRETPLVAISPDGKTVATSRTLKTAVSLWSVETGEVLGAPIETQSEITALAIGPENQLATAGSGEIRLWDLNSRTPLAYLDPKQSAVRFLRYSPSGSFLAVVGFVGRDIELWDTESHNLVAVLKSDDRVEDVAFSPDGRTLVASGQAATTQAWAVVDPDVRTRLSGFDAATRSMAFRPDGLLALGSWRGTTRFWNAGHCLNGIPSTKAMTTTPVVVTTTSATTTGNETRDDSARRDRPASLAFDNLGRLITIDQDALRLFENPPGSLESTAVNLPETPKLPFNWTILASSSSGERMAIARSGQVMLWKASEPKQILTVTPPAGTPSSGRGDRGGGGRGPGMFWRAIAVSSSGDRLYLIDQEGNTVAWSLEGHEARSLGWTRTPRPANALALSPDGTVLAVGHGNGLITLIDTVSGQARGPLSRGDAEGRAEAIAFSPDGQKLAVGTQQGHIDVWSLNNPTTPPLRLPGHRGLVTALAFDPKGHYLASAGLDRTADVWNLERLREEFGKLGLDW